MKKTNLKQRVAIYVVAIMLLFSVGMPTIANANVGFEEQYEEVFDELSEYWEFSYDNSGSMLSDEESDELSDRIAQLFDASHSEFNRLDSDCDSATSEVHLLVVKTFVEMDFSELGAKQVICWFYRKTILEFSSEDEMLTAYEYLSLLPNVEWVEIDSYLPCRDDSDIFSYISEWNHYGVERHSSFEPFVTNSWGVGRTNNDRFAEYVLHSGFARNAMIVAVIDSGVDTEHRIFRNPDGSSRIYGGRNFIGTASDLTNRGDAEHGTAVAGIIVDNTPGLNHVQIMPIVVDGAGGTPIRVADGIRWAARRDGVQVMNMSFRIRGDVNVLGVNTIESAIQYAVNRGITVVVAAGNEGRSIDPAVLGEVVLGGVSPARMPGVITVAATTRDNERWILTNWGNRVNISAPGHAVRTSCHISGESAAFTGTSMAVPHVSAAVAMYRMRDPELSSATVRHRIETRYVETPGNWRRDRYGNGILNMARAIPAGWQPPGGGTPPTTPPNLPVHTVTFFPNGGSGGSARYTQNFVHGQAQNLRRNTWTRPGYTFMGWASIPNGNVHYTEGQRVNILASHHLYAVWQIVHTVTFWPNDGGSANRWYTQTFVHDQAQYLRRNTWQRPGYAFVGWASIPNGNVHYTEGQRVNILASHYLYAVWRPIGRATITSVTTTNNGRVTVNWTSSGNATNYDIYLIQHPWTWNAVRHHVNRPAGTTSHTFSGVASGAYRAFIVARPNADDIQSNAYPFEVLISDRAVITSVNTTNTGEVTVNWNSVPGGAGYRIYILQYPWSWYDIRHQAIRPPGTTSHTFTGVASGAYNVFIVTEPNNRYIQSVWHTFEVVTSDRAVITSVNATSYGRVTVNWNSVPGGEGYRIYIIQYPWSWNDIRHQAVRPPGTTSHTFTGVANGEYNVFIVTQPNNRYIQSVWRTFEVRPPARAVITGVNVSGRNVTVNWNSVPGVASYDIYIIQAPWSWNDIRHHANRVPGTTSHTFTGLLPGRYYVFIVTRPNDRYTQSIWHRIDIS